MVDVGELPLCADLPVTAELTPFFLRQGSVGEHVRSRTWAPAV